MVGDLSKGAYQGEDVQPISRAYYNAHCPNAWRTKYLRTWAERDSGISHTAKKDGNIRNGDKLSATSTNMMLFVLNLAFEYACDMEYIEENSCVRVRRTKAETKKIEAFTIEEQIAIEM